MEQKRTIYPVLRRGWYIAATTPMVHDGTGRPLGMTKEDVEETSGPQHDGRTMFLANHLIPQASY